MFSEKVDQENETVEQQPPASTKKEYIPMTFEETKNQKLIDKARVNLGIAQANTVIENYKFLVLNDLNGLLDWKIKRQMKRWEQIKFIQSIQKWLNWKTLSNTNQLNIHCN